MYKEKILEELGKLKDVDLDFITGGAVIDENISSKNNYKETFNSQRCDCNAFESSIGKSSLNICDNCVWARAPKAGTNKIYCTKQKLSTKNEQ